MVDGYACLGRAGMEGTLSLSEISPVVGPPAMCTEKHICPVWCPSAQMGSEHHPP